MKTFKMIFTAAILLLTVTFANAQSGKTQRTIGITTQAIHVSGACSMDKRRIEIAAYTVQGVKSSHRDDYTHILILTLQCI